MGLPNEITELIERFDRNRESYLSGQYNETQLRREFLDPFFTALGWDVVNKQGYAEAYKDVIHEDALKIGGATKAPDYCFRIGGVKKFFVEAKKPSVNLKEDVSPAFQLRRYAWSAKLPLSILTDFEEFAVYDCRIKPAQTDKASAGRVLYLTYKDYPARWDELISIFAREAVLKGSFDKYAESSKLKKGTATVDDAFLSEIEDWRDMLARNIALRNGDLTQRELNFAVQRTIDRIVFLRICEDRGIEDYGKLQMQLNGTNVYRRLVQLFSQADDRYNSGLFHFQREKDRHEEPDKLTPNISIDDKPLKDIIKRLYYPDSPYEFSVLSADILGQVYEQFLGKVIRLTDGHQAKVEEKPEVRKAGGVYYTPKYIVDYIVKNTVGHLVGVPASSRRDACPDSGQPQGVAPTKQNITPKDVSKIKILDPACGSGSFLLGAYQYLLDWHLKWYIENDPEKWARARQPAIYQGPSLDPRTPNWHLTTTEKKRILLNNIYGVDIDSQAVEVTKLSLLLKVLEGENSQTLAAEFRLFHQRALPDLGDNIKCGNSLIGPDFYQQQSLLDDEERYRINVFDWEKEFPAIMRAGGFDAVIGNPPYIRMESFKNLKDYLKANYISHDERSDLYAYFIEKEHKLLNNRGRFGMIVSNKFLRANYGEPLRNFLNENAAIERVVDFAGLPVFKGATVRTIVLITSRKGKNKRATLYSPPMLSTQFNAIESGSLSVDQAIADITYEVKSDALTQSVWSFGNMAADDLLNRLKALFAPLIKYCDGQIYMGIKSGLTAAFVIDKAMRTTIIKGNGKEVDIIKPFLNGRDVRRYVIDYKQNYLIYTYHGIDINKYPAAEQHLKAFKERLTKRATKQEWYELQQPQYNFSKYMDQPKIIFPDIATRPRFALDEVGYYSSNTTYFIPRRDLYLLGLLNSSLGCFYFERTCAGLEGKNETYLRFFGQYLEGFPVRTIDTSNKTDEARHDKMVSLVDQMLSLNKRMPEAKTNHEKTSLQRQIDATDQQIDQLIYELYGLTEEEIRIVEGR
jgi:type I restriction-modification system DNA methylase subunit